MENSVKNIVCDGLQNDEFGTEVEKLMNQNIICFNLTETEEKIEQPRCFYNIQIMNSRNLTIIITE